MNFLQRRNKIMAERLAHQGKQYKDIFGNSLSSPSAPQKPPQDQIPKPIHPASIPSTDPSRNINERLPPDILHHIFKQLTGTGFQDTDPAIFNVLLVCEYWRMCTFEIIFHINTSNEIREATWVFLDHRMRRFERDCDYARNMFGGSKPPLPFQVQVRVDFVRETGKVLELQGLGHLLRKEAAGGTAMDWLYLVSLGDKKEAK